MAHNKDFLPPGPNEVVTGFTSLATKKRNGIKKESRREEALN